MLLHVRTPVTCQLFIENGTMGVRFGNRRDRKISLCVGRIEPLNHLSSMCRVTWNKGATTIDAQIVLHNGKPRPICKEMMLHIDAHGERTLPLGKVRVRQSRVVPASPCESILVDIGDSTF